MLNRVLHHIGGQWPKRIAVAEMADLLCDHYSRRSRRSAVSAIAFIGVRLPMVILRGVAGGFLSLYRSPLKYPVSLSKRPETSPLVRMQARWGNKVSSWLHYAVKLSPFERALVDKLDGAQDLNALVRRVIEEPEPKSHRNGDAPALNDQATPDEVRELVVRSLQRFLKCGLLVG